MSFHFENSVDRSTGQRDIAQIIETFYNAKLSFAVRNNRLDPDLEIPN